MKTTIHLLTSILLFATAALAASPTPAPTTPAPVPLTVTVPSQVLTAKSLIPPALLQANLNAVPATPQSLLQLLATFTPLPSGVTPDKIKNVTVIITPNGGANVSVQYVAP